MKKNKIIGSIIFFSVIIIAVVVLSIIIARELYNNKLIEEQEKKELLINQTNESITFKEVKYKVKDEVIYYEENIELGEGLEKEFSIIATTLKTNYPGTSIVYLNREGRFKQIINGFVIDNTEMYIEVNNQGKCIINEIETEGLRVGLNNNLSIITSERAKQITIDLLSDKNRYFSTLKNSFYTDIICSIESYYKDSVPCYKMRFNVGDSYIIINAITGEIIDTYFFNGIIY